MTEKNYIYKKLSDGRYIKEIDSKTEHLASAEEDAKLATDIRSLLQGVQGESGTSGTSGESGTSGRDGAKGDIGRTGLTGPRGLNGTSGSSGSSGQDGSSGVNGQDGTSGINGRKGDKGDKGDRGFPGLQGPAGQNGSAGVSGTSGTSGSSGVSGSNILSSLFFSGNIIAPIVTNSTGIGSGAITSNSIFLAPFVFARETVVTSFSYEMSSLTGNNARIYIYSDLNGKPLNKLVESTNLSTATNGYKTFLSTFTFSAGVTYWQGIQCNSSTPGFRSAAIAATLPIGYPPTQGNAIYNSYGYTASAFNLPSTLTQSSLFFRAGVVPIVFMTV